MIEEVTDNERISVIFVYNDIIVTVWSTFDVLSDEWFENGIEYTICCQKNKNMYDYPIDQSTVISKLLKLETAEGTISSLCE